MAPRMTLPTQAVLQAVLQALLESHDERYGLEIIRASGLVAGTVYPILQHLESAGWLDARWESPVAAHEDGRPPRRYYALSPEGRTRAVNALTSTGPQRRQSARLLAGPEIAPGA